MSSAATLLGALEAAEARLKSRRVEPSGRLRITSSVTFGRRFIAPLVTTFLVEHPAVKVELTLLDRVVDLLEEGIDVAVRLMRLPDSSLVAIPIGETRRVVVGSPALAERLGVPASVAALATMPCVTFTGVAPADEWAFERNGAPVRVPVNTVLATNQIDAAVQAAVAGVGWTQFLDYQVHEDLAAGRLQRVLRDDEPAPIPAHIVYPHARLLSANVRAFVDFATPRLRAQMAELQS